MGGVLAGVRHPGQCGGACRGADTARDHGTPPPADATRRETARALSAAYPRIPASTLAEHADAAVFSGTTPSEAVASGYWRTVDESVAVITSDGSLWARLRGRYSLASLRAARLARRESGDRTGRGADGQDRRGAGTRRRARR